MTETDKSVASNEISQIRAEVEKVGRQEFFDRIQRAARGALSRFPTNGETKKVDALSLRYLEQVRELVSTGLTLSGKDDEELVRFAREIAWAKLSSSIAANLVAELKNNGGGSGSSLTCVSRCAAEYDQCVNENQ
jgi:hypothetical protein